ncbi:MAG: glycoside hydrolase family 28 protein [Pseudomonadota bacterium]
MDRKTGLSIDRRSLLLSACGVAFSGFAFSSTRSLFPQRDAEAVVGSIRAPSIPGRRLVLQRPRLEVADNRSVVQEAIDRTNEKGGGTVVIPAGRWFIDGPLLLKSNVCLHLEDDAHVVFSPRPESYLPPVLTRWEGTEVYTYSPMLFAQGQSNIAVTGKGKFDGQGRAHWLPWRKNQAPIKKILRDMGRDGVPVEERIFVGERRLRPYFVQFKDCQSVLVDGPTFVDSPFWIIHPLYCEDVIVRNIKCVSRHINSDGVDPDSSRRVLIENCDFDVGDDGVSIKSGRDQDGWRVGRPSEDIVVRNCVYSGDTGGGVAIGSEMSGGVRRVYVDGFELPKASHTLFFKANLDRGGMIEDVFIRRIQAGDVKSAIVFSNEYHSYRGGESPPIFRNVAIEDVTVEKAHIGLSIQGHERAPVENVDIQRVEIRDVKHPLMMAHTKNVSLFEVEANGRVLSLSDAVPVDASLVGH